jgi:hypothetical protein
MAWDVEHPDEEGLTPEERLIRKRRVGWYERLGGTLLPIHDYTNPHSGEEHPMLLLAQRADNSSMPTGEALQNLAEDIRRQVDKHRWGRDKPVPATVKCSSQ